MHRGEEDAAQPEARRFRAITQQLQAKIGISRPALGALTEPLTPAHMSSNCRQCALQGLLPIASSHRLLKKSQSRFARLYRSGGVKGEER
jgi:hypothetical protein